MVLKKAAAGRHVGRDGWSWGRASRRHTALVTAVMAAAAATVAAAVQRESGVA
jgi:hypothetical protein|tara:strand:+ start:679 stop:837 length:159 start_codon:yes stop_codon:yes gene_type:complete